MVHRYLLLSSFFALTLSTRAQSLENLTSSFDGERVIITYNLAHADANQKFVVSFYSSHDNYAKPIAVTGDVGDHVLPGKTKRAVWDARAVLPPDFDGDVRIKIKTSRAAAPPLTVEPLALQTYKRGRTISMKWNGGYSDDKIRIELLKNNTVDQIVIDQVDNSSAYEWKMPKSVKKGKDYQLRISTVKRPAENVTSASFNIKPRTPFIVKALPILAVGGVFIFLSGDDGGGGGSWKEIRFCQSQQSREDDTNSRLKIQDSKFKI